MTLSGTALAKLGLTSVGDGLAGQTLTIAATGGGTATSITFGLGTGQVSTLNELNAKLAANNLQATIDSATGKINIVTTNDAASSTIGTIGGTAAVDRWGLQRPDRCRAGCRPERAVAACEPWWRSTTTC